ncbi:L-aminoadipate-semialdehyde dehydrogenase-phosphopantetheinyl transferase [Cladorrhinum sp. PSN259]|nr:L-aminoadipate-semialdehyde dehydrogenase-phosphopantetheinyl transferase [Cladorrhinum sp. PSN259]
MAASKPVQWILDTRSWYSEATETRHLETHASRALALLTPTERDSVLRYFHLRDAKLSLASALLKRYAVAKLAPSSPKWSSTTLTRNSKTKPIWIDPSTQQSPVSFNISHQAGIVALIALASPTAELGVDVVCTSERRERDHAHIAKEGWASFVDMHADVFGPGEVQYLKYQVLSAVPGLVASKKAEDVVDAKLRAFYALWALREAYVKLTGEALLANWLKELEFREFRPPKPTKAWDVPADEGEEAGEVVRDVDIRFRGKKVEDVNMCLRSMGPDYMIATAARTPEDKEEALGWKLGPYEILSLDEVLEFAESRN